MKARSPKTRYWTAENITKVALTSKRTFMAALSAGMRTSETKMWQVHHIVRHLIRPP